MVAAEAMVAACTGAAVVAAEATAATASAEPPELATDCTAAVVTEAVAEAALAADTERAGSRDRGHALAGEAGGLRRYGGGGHADDLGHQVGGDSEEMPPRLFCTMVDTVCTAVCTTCATSGWLATACASGTGGDGGWPGSVIAIMPAEML